MRENMVGSFVPAIAVAIKTWVKPKSGLAS